MNFKKIAIGALATLVVLFLIGFLIPRNFRVERETTIIAAPKMVFTFIGDLSRWKQWTTWSKQDPEMEMTISSPSYGVGATQSWKSKTMGEGSVKVTEWSNEQVIGYDLNIEGFNPAHATLRMSFPRQGATINWVVEGSVGSSSLQRWFGLLVRWFMGRDITKGLNNLKALAESSVAAEIKAPWNEVVIAPKPKTTKK